MFLNSSYLSPLRILGIPRRHNWKRWRHIIFSNNDVTNHQHREDGEIFALFYGFIWPMRRYEINTKHTSWWISILIFWQATAPNINLGAKAPLLIFGLLLVKIWGYIFTTRCVLSYYLIPGEYNLYNSTFLAWWILQLIFTT